MITYMQHIDQRNEPIAMMSTVQLLKRDQPLNTHIIQTSTSPVGADAMFIDLSLNKLNMESPTSM